MILHATIYELVTLSRNVCYPNKMCINSKHKAAKEYEEKKLLSQMKLKMCMKCESIEQMVF